MRNSKKLLFILVTVILVLGGTTAYAAVTGFTDIAGTTHEKSIVWAVDNGITVGYADGTFKPNNPNTRGQMTTFLNRFYDNLVKPIDTRVAALEAGNGTGGSVSGCVECHNDSTLITGKEAAWKTSLHGSGEVFMEDGTETGCAGCHSGGTFSNMVAAGLTPDKVTNAQVVPDPTPQDCRACHQIHVTGTGADWKLETTAAVALFATPGKTFDGGAGNLCANCHQARRVYPTPGTSAEATVTINSRFGPHHGPQSDMLIGTAGAGTTGVLDGAPMMHYTGVKDTCVGCHTSHTFEPDLAACTVCHGTQTKFDVGGFQTEVATRLTAIGNALVTAGYLTPGPEGPLWEDASVKGTSAPKNTALALWNFLYIGREDKSMGAHNPSYVDKMLDASELALGLPNGG